MEIYIAPPADKPDAALSRQQVLAALAKAGLGVAGQTERAGSGAVSTWWSINFVGSDVRVELQETERGLVFATLEQSMFDSSPIPDRVCSVLEQLGWEIDQENVG